MSSRIGNVCPSCGTRYPNDTQFCPLDGTKLVPITSDAYTSINLTGERIFGDYIMLKKLGEGGMGSVYLAENQGIDQRIAIKVLHPAGQKTEELVQRFNREARTISRLTHPNIIRVFIFGKTQDNLVYLAMEYVEGRSLRELFDEEQTLPPGRAIRILRQVLHALEEAHELGIIHRDLKPDNIMLTTFRGVDDFVKVLDFGIAKVQEKEEEVQKKLTQAGVVYGTPEYLSPEQASAKPLDGRSDLYSLGIILYEMMTGTVPFTGATSHAVLAGHVFESPPDPSEVTEQPVPKDIERIILKAISKSPDDRYQTAMEFLHDLESFEASYKGKTAKRTTALDPTESTRVFEASKASESEEQELVAAKSNTEANQHHQNNQHPVFTTSDHIAANAQKKPSKSNVPKTAIAAITILLVAIVVLAILLYQRTTSAHHMPNPHTAHYIISRPMNTVPPKLTYPPTPPENEQQLVSPGGSSPH